MAFEKWIVCRLCLEQPNEIMAPIFNADASKDLTSMILECGGVPIKQFDHYPDKICTKCLKQLHKAHKFRETCRSSYKQLSRFVAPIEIEKSAAGTLKIDDAAVVDEQTEFMISDTLLLEEEYTNSNESINIEQAGLDIDETDEFVVELQTQEDNVLISTLENQIIDNAKEAEDEVLDDIVIEEEFVTEDEDLYEPISEDDFEDINEFGTVGGVCTINKSVACHKSSTTVQAPRRKEFQQFHSRLKNNKASKLSTFICTLCGNIYPTEGRLKLHIKSHYGVRPHECKICGHAFGQNQQLVQHMNTHTGNRPYKCQFCPSAFAHLSTRNKHHRIHTNERPYVCDICGEDFAYSKTLNTHKKLHIEGPTCV